MRDPATRRVGQRLRRLRPAERFFPIRPAPAASSPLAWLYAALWLGLFTGVAEVGLVLALKPLRDRTPGFFHMNRHLVWMIPLFHATVFLTCGTLIAALARSRPGFSPRRAAIFLATLSTLSLTLAVRSIHPAACVVLAAGLGYRLAPWVERWVVARATPVRVALPCLAALALGMAGLTVGREAAAGRLGPATPGAPNVLLIVLDTVGAGHLGLYGYGRDTSPQLERIARRGIRFDNARSAAPWTLPSHASMFTGRWPHELSAGFDGPLDASVPTLAEYFRDRGYATAGLIANTLYCSAETGLNRGFTHYEDHELGASAVVHSAALGQRLLEKVTAAVGRSASPGRATPVRPYKDAARINRDALRWLSTRGDRPFFLFLNYFDAHTPYLLPEGGRREHFGLAPRARADFHALDHFWTADKRALSDRELTLARDAYDDCIAWLDDQLGRLFDELDRRGLLDDTLVVITADHGEQLGEHQLYGHAGSLYRQETHVPLVIVPPRGAPAGRAVAEPVSLRNLPATVVDLVGGGDSPFPGSSLARQWDPTRAGERPASDPVLSEVLAPATNNPNQGRSPVFRGSMASIVAEGKVYIRNGDGVEELYDLAGDPGDSRNLAGAAESAGSLSRIRADLERLVGPTPRRPATGPSAPTVPPRR